MILESTGRGEWPTGTHWTPGEVREVPDHIVIRFAPTPEWLREVPAKDDDSKEE